MAGVRSCARSFRPSLRSRPDRVPAHHRGGPVAGQQVVATSSAKLRTSFVSALTDDLTVFRVAADGASRAAPAAVCTASKLACRSSTWVAYSEVASATTSCSADLTEVTASWRAAVPFSTTCTSSRSATEAWSPSVEEHTAGGAELSADELVPSEEQPAVTAPTPTTSSNVKKRVMSRTLT